MATQANAYPGIRELSSPAALKASLAELIGTALFVLLGVGAVASAAAGEGDASVAVALAHGFAFGLLVAGTAAVSGGHINPAVTFAMLITGRVSATRGVMYIVAQLLGACLGALLLRALIADGVLAGVPGGGGHALAEAVSEPWHGLLLTALGTFALVWTLFSVGNDRRAGSGTLAPLYMGLAVAAVYLFLYPLTGGGINPARTLGPALFLPGAEGVAGRWSDAWVYYIGPLLGGGAAGLGYFVLYLMPGRGGEA